MTNELSFPNTDPAQSFAQAFAQGFSQTTSFLLSKGARFEVAEEVAQVAWARGWEARHQLKSVESIFSWINTIAYRRLCNHNRFCGRSAQLSETADARSREPVAAVDAALLLRRCSPLDRSLLKQRYVEGMELKEIAAHQGLSEMAVRLRIHRCQRGLRTFAARRLAAESH